MVSKGSAGGASPDGSTIITNSAGELVATKHLDLINDVAEARFGASVAQESMDDVLFDVFVNQDKISSSSTVSINAGQNGDVELLPSVDGFESGDFTENNWTLDENSGITIETQQSIVKNGSYAAKVSCPGSNDGDRMITTNKDLVPSDADGETFSFWFRSTSGGLNFNNGPFAGVRTGGSKAGTIRTDANDTGDLAVDTDTQGENLLYDSASTGTWYKLFIDIDETNSELTFRIENDSGTQLGSTTVSYGGGAIDEVFIGCRDGTGTSYEYYYDDVGFESISSKNGNIQSTTKSLGYTPTKAVVHQDAVFTGSGDITYKISDSSGNTKTVNQSDVDSEVTLSFGDGDVDVKAEFSNSSSTDKARLNEYGVMFV